MSLLAIGCTAVCAICVLILGWIALKPLPEEMAEAGPQPTEELCALHAQRFPQLRQTLATLDADYLRRCAPGEIERHLQEERTLVIQAFLAGLGQDFARLERLMRAVQDMSPADPWIHQFQRTTARSRFRLNYRIASLQIRSARLGSSHRLSRLTELLGNLSAEIEAGTARWMASASFHSPHKGADR